MNLISVEPDNLKKTFLNWDKLQPLLQPRARFQMVDTNDSGSWVVNGEEWIEKYFKDNNRKAWKMHTRIKIHSINVLALAA